MAYRAIAPSLSEISMHLDVPLEIAQVETKDLLTHNVHISFVTPSIEVPLAINPTSRLMADYRGFASLYREAMNTNSPVYGFLCLFKMIEALKARRIRLERAARRQGSTYSRPNEILPTTNAEVKVWLDGLFYAQPEWDLMALESAVPLEVRGRTIESVVQEVLNPLRVDVAHALFTGKGGELTSSSDELLHLRQITKNLPLTRSIVRRMLKTDFPTEFLNHLPG